MFFLCFVNFSHIKWRFWGKRGYDDFEETVCDDLGETNCVYPAVIMRIFCSLFVHRIFALLSELEKYEVLFNSFADETQTFPQAHGPFVF